MGSTSLASGIPHGSTPLPCVAVPFYLLGSVAQFTEWRWKKPGGERFLQALNGRFLPFALMRLRFASKSVQI